MTELLNKTLSEIVTQNFQAARVFEVYGFDFCCRGKRSLQEVCDEKQLPVDKILPELYKALETPDRGGDFNNMSLTELCEYIVRVHHAYVKKNMPEILNYVQRVSTKHGDRFPFMQEVYGLFDELAEEMTLHMQKEETVLFPRIKLVELNAHANNSSGYLAAAIAVMEQEHDHAGTIMQKIRALTGNYNVQEQICTTFRLALNSLKAFEEDLHQHVHLENNILFPKSAKLFLRLNGVKD